jgi:hypothetical protein
MIYNWLLGTNGVQPIFGFVKKAEITNSNKDYNITVLDGIQNIIPNGVSDL